MKSYSVFIVLSVLTGVSGIILSITQFVLLNKQENCLPSISRAGAYEKSRNANTAGLTACSVLMLLGLVGFMLSTTVHTLVKAALMLLALFCTASLFLQAVIKIDVTIDWDLHRVVARNFFVSAYAICFVFGVVFSICFEVSRLRNFFRLLTVSLLLVAVTQFMKMQGQLCLDFSERPSRRSDDQLQSFKAAWQYCMVGALFAGMLLLVR